LGWAQNSLISVDAETRRYRWNHEYYLLKHVAGLVRRGAQRIAATSWIGYEDVLAFRNVDGTIAVVAHNPLSEPLVIRFGLGEAVAAVTMPADSFGSVLLKL
jgi:glucosylceramidase